MTNLYWCLKCMLLVLFLLCVHISFSLRYPLVRYHCMCLLEVQVQWSPIIMQLVIILWFSIYCGHDLSHKCHKGVKQAEIQPHIWKSAWNMHIDIYLTTYGTITVYFLDNINRQCYVETWSKKSLPPWWCIPELNTPRVLHHCIAHSLLMWLRYGHPRQCYNRSIIASLWLWLEVWNMYSRLIHRIVISGWQLCFYHTQAQ